MPYVLQMTPPNGAPEYLPRGFGFTAHAHTSDIADAEAFDTKAAAMRRGNAYRWPSAFWDSEIAHRDRMARKFAGWAFATVSV